MSETTALTRLIRFGVYEVDLHSGELRKRGLKIKLHGQPMEVLTMLLEHPGELVTRDQIQKRLWPTETFVDFEHSLNTAVKKLREALGDDADNPHFVETLPRHGYRFIALVFPGMPVSSVAPVSSPVDASPARGDGDIAGTAARAIHESPLRKLCRPATIAGVTAALVVAVAIVLALNVAGLRDRLMATVGAGSARPREGGARLYPHIESIAVLPLENLSHDPEQEYFADGMTEELTTNLGKISTLRVISRTTAMHYKRTNKTLPDIARELSVDAVVEGSVLRSGNRVRINANLLHAPTDRHLWADSYESDMQDVLVLQGQVARAIALAIHAKLNRGDEMRLLRPLPLNPDA